MNDDAERMARIAAAEKQFIKDCMAILRRILKYAPAVLLGLLVVAWVVSLRFEFKVVLQTSARSGKSMIYQTGLLPSTVQFTRFETDGTLNLGGVRWTAARKDEPLRLRLLGLAHVQGTGPWRPQAHMHIEVPMPLLVIAILPLAIGPFLSFRFGLWHYLTYTALVAVQLGYYLRWQE